MDKKKKPQHLIRLNFIFITVFLLFSMLVLRLGFVQIVYGENFKRELARRENISVNHPVPRGKMLDRNFKVIIDNLPKNAITYTNYGVGEKEMLITAKRLARLLDINTDKVTEREKKDYWVLKHPHLADAKISKKEKILYNLTKLSDNDIYNLKLSRITNKDLQALNHEDLKVISIYRDIISGYRYTPIIVKNDHVTKDEFAMVSENLPFLPGVDTTTDWERSYLFGKTLQSVLGTVSNSDEGLPADSLDYFLSRGYSRNDRVGKGYLEWQYEDILRGRKRKVQNITDKKGNVLETQVILDGQRGKDLILSIDMDLQKAVEKIIEEELWSAKRLSGTRFLDRAYVVLMEPHTGEVLTMAGKRLVQNKETGKAEMEDDALGTFTTTYNVGSTVKGATVLTGYKTGAITPGTVFDDSGIKIKGTPIKKSYMYMGKVNEIEALKKSSNVYMFRTAIRIGKGEYKYNEPIDLSSNAFDIIRNSFSSFGLGTRTGIDLPNEQTGYKGTSSLPGFLLDLVIGQYDTYSPMQLAQYVSTIANGGYRMQPHLVKEIREPINESTETGPVFKEMKPVVLNTIDAKKEWLKRVQTGFNKVMQEEGGTAFKFFGDAPYYPAGKTGTAQAFYDGPERGKYGKEPPPVMNLSLVAYAPSSNPEVAMSIIVPWAYDGKDDNKVNMKIGRRVLDTYFGLKSRYSLKKP